MSEVAQQYGPYTRVRRLGAGGMAETFLAVQRGAAGFEQRVCMKFILPAYRSNADFRRLFLREASIAASLRHSNIVGVIDVDAEAGYLVLELVDGVDLRALLNSAPNRRIPGELATLIIIELCKALAYAHGRKRGGEADGVVHRDVSPSNVLISYAGEVKLTDFGVARAMRADEPHSMTIKGKLCYMSPEQARGQVVDGRSDLFSLGIVAYELLSGQRPFDGGSDADTLLRITAGQHPPLIDVAPDVPGGLAAIVERLLCRDREQRFASAQECIDALSRFTPRATAFRALGEMARAARPHETIPNLPAVPELPFDPTMTSGNAVNPLTQTQALPDEARIVPRTSPPHSLPRAQRPGETTSAAASFLQALRGVRPNAWGALGFSLVLLVGVGVAWSTQSHGTVAPRNDVREPRTIEPNWQPPQAGSKGPVILIQQKTSEPGGGTELQAPPPPPPPAPQPPTPPEPLEPPEPTVPPAVVTIGVVPAGQVWVDNHLIGWAPVREYKLAPGVHTFGAGSTEQEVHKRVRLKSGSNSGVVLSLDGHHDSDRRDGTTTDPKDR